MALFADFSEVNQQNPDNLHIYRASVCWSENNETLRQEHIIVAKDSQTAKIMAHNRAPYRLVKEDKPNPKDQIQITIRDYGAPLPNRTYYTSPILENNISEILPGKVQRRRIIENPEAYYQELWEKQQASQINTDATLDDDNDFLIDIPNQNRTSQKSENENQKIDDGNTSNTEENPPIDFRTLDWSEFSQEQQDTFCKLTVDITETIFKLFYYHLPDLVLDSETERFYETLQQTEEWKDNIPLFVRSYMVICQYCQSNGQENPDLTQYCQSSLLQLEKQEEDIENENQ